MGPASVDRPVGTVTVTARVTVIGPARRAPDGHLAECRLELDIAAGNPRLGLDFKIYR